MGVNPEGTLNSLNPNPALRRGSSGAFGGGGDGDGGGAAAAAAAAAGSNGNAGAQFIGPGEAVGEDSVLRAGRGSWEAQGGGPGGAGGLDGGGAMASTLNRTQAVRDTQLLWIPAAGLESLALAAPRAFVSLVWRMGAR